MTGKELNFKKRKEIIPMIDEMIYQYQYQGRKDYISYVTECFEKLESLLKNYNIPTDTFNKLNIYYRKMIENKMKEYK